MGNEVVSWYKTAKYLTRRGKLFIGISNMALVWKLPTTKVDFPANSGLTLLCLTSSERVENVLYYVCNTYLLKILLFIRKKKDKKLLEEDMTSLFTKHQWHTQIYDGLETYWMVHRTKKDQFTTRPEWQEATLISYLGRMLIETYWPKMDES